MNIQYTIQFFSEWHCGSGLASGADVDALVIKDKNDLPFIPGKTLKGLIREVTEDIFTLRKQSFSSSFVQVFGNSEDKDVLNGSSEVKMRKGTSFFTNAELPHNIRDIILAEGTAKYLFRRIASTAVDENGIAVEHSLRKMETVVPCILEAEILNVPDDILSDMENALKFIKRMGQNRNRGLGRCQFIISRKGGNE